MNLQENINRIKNIMGLPERVYNYEPGRNTVPDRLPFDILKLIDAGVVFITPAIDGDPESPTYKEWLNEPGAHLITLYNVEHSSEDDWIKKAITKQADPTPFHRKDLTQDLYDGKYNQILWGLEKLGIDPNAMLYEKTDMNEGLDDTSWMDDEGNKVTLRDLLTISENIPVVDFPVEYLKPYLLDWGGDPEEMIKVKKADLQYPILIFVDNEGNIISIIDGHHRARKAIMLGREFINAKLIPLSSLPDDIGGVFKHLNSEPD